MFTIYKGNQNIVQETLTDKAAKVRALLREADATRAENAAILMRFMET